MASLADVETQKRLIRQEFVSRRKALDAELRREYDAAICANIRNLPIFQASGYVAAFIRHGAVQCGFCSPGMILSAEHLLSRNADPSEEEIRRGLSGNLCRCTGYQQMVDAITEVAAARREKES